METLTDNKISEEYSEVGVNTLLCCDRCGAQAYSIAYKEDMALLFCGHHTRKYLPGLASGGWSVDDRTHYLTATTHDDDDGGEDE